MEVNEEVEQIQPNQQIIQIEKMEEILHQSENVDNLVDEMDETQRQELIKLDMSLEASMATAAVASPTPKRKKVVLNFVQKFEILDKLKAGVKVADIAQEYNIGVTTVCDIRKNGDEKLLKYRKENIFNLSRKSSKSSEFPLLDKALKIKMI